MKTKIFNRKQLKQAGELIKKGELIAFPTETVYGLGANALNPKAVKKIFVVKGRPSNNPLIIHVCNLKQVEEIAYLNPLAKKLIKKFWPGPLTIILKKKKIVPKEVTAGLRTVAIRMPDNKTALALIKYSNCPIAAPSANISGKPSGTCFEHVYEDFGGKIAGIIKSRQCKIGIESTVLDLTQKIPEILRPGKIIKKQIEKIIGRVRESKGHVSKPKSPGMAYKHYSPNAKVIIVKNKSQIKEVFKKYSGKKIKLLIYKNAINMAHNLFKDFRDADKKGFDIIIVKSIQEKSLGNAIMNRLRKGGKIYQS